MFASFVVVAVVGGCMCGVVLYCVVNIFIGLRMESAVFPFVANAIYHTHSDSSFFITFLLNHMYLFVSLKIMFSLVCVCVYGVYECRRLRVFRKTTKFKNKNI